MKNKQERDDVLNQYEEAVNHLTRYFIKKYFKEADYYWVADEIGGVACIGDYFFSLQDMADFLKYRYSEKLMFEYYETSLEQAMKPKTKHGDKQFMPCIRDWKKVRGTRIAKNT